MKNKFVTKDGFLTVYALACGYHETNFEWALPQGTRIVNMWHEGACFHVRTYQEDKPGWIAWDCFQSLPDARKAFVMACKAGNTKRKINKPW
jgi:hypothetical protein